MFTRHLTQLITFDLSVFGREAFKNSLLKGQGAINFVFVRIYKSANIEYLKKKSDDGMKNFGKIAKSFENAYTQNSSYILYLSDRENFKNFLRNLFMPSTSLERISNYINWQRIHEAGLSTATLNIYDTDEKNYY